MKDDAMIFRFLRETVEARGSSTFAMVKCRRDPKDGAPLAQLVVATIEPTGTWCEGAAIKFAACVRDVATKAEAEWVALAFPGVYSHAFEPSGPGMVLKVEHEAEAERAWVARLMCFHGAHVLGQLQPLQRVETQHLDRMHPRGRVARVLQ